MQSELKYWYLRNHKLFWVLSNSQIKQLCIISRFKQAKKGDIIYLPNDDVPKVYFLKKGNIKIVFNDDQGNEIIKDIIRTGDLFGELGLQEGTDSEEQAVALTNDVVICSFLLADFENLMQQYPDLAISYTKLVGFQLRRIKNNYSNLVFKDAKSRLISFLKDWCEKEGQIIGTEIQIKNYLTQNEIAQIICTSRQTATQLLNEMEESGILKYDRKLITILKPAEILSN
ncbi:MAG TPA: Crp/Fnr family transcriptional regulator [Bacteroidia bacterium]